MFLFSLNNNSISLLQKMSKQVVFLSARFEPPNTFWYQDSSLTAFVATVSIFCFVFHLLSSLPRSLSPFFYEGDWLHVNSKNRRLEMCFISSLSLFPLPFVFPLPFFYFLSKAQVEIMWLKDGPKRYSLEGQGFCITTTTSHYILPSCFSLVSSLLSVYCLLFSLFCFLIIFQSPH